MIDIDPDMLEEAIKEVSERLYSAEGLRVIAAARAHLATLPRFKEVEVEQWAIINRQGFVVDTSCADKDEAEATLGGYIDGCQIVRLTGTAKVRVP